MVITELDIIYIYTIAKLVQIAALLLGLHRPSAIPCGPIFDKSFHAVLFAPFDESSWLPCLQKLLVIHFTRTYKFFEINEVKLSIKIDPGLLSSLQYGGCFLNH